MKDSKHKALQEAVAKKTMHKVSDYNREAGRRYSEAVSKWKPGAGGFPHRGMYTYSHEKTGEERKRGRVVSWEHPEGGKGSRYFHKRKDAEAYHQSKEV